MLNPDARGKGYAKEAIRLTMVFAFEVLKLDVVTLETMLENVPFKGLMKNFGLEGVEMLDEKGNKSVKWFLKRNEWLDGKGRLV